MQAGCKSQLLTQPICTMRVDERLVQLKNASLEHLEECRGSKTASSAVLNSELVANIAQCRACCRDDNEAEGLSQLLQQRQEPPQQQQQQKRQHHQQQEQQRQQEEEQQWPASSGLVLAAAQQQWQALLLERLRAAQHFLPDMPLVAAARSQQELQHLRGTTGLADAWERIGSCDSPFTSCLQAPSVTKLLYDADDVLQALLAAADVPVGSSTSPVGSTNSSSGTGSSTTDSSCQQQQSQPHHQQQHMKMNLLQAVRAPTRFWLQSFFGEIRPDRRQVGLDDVLHAVFREQQVQQAQRAAASCSSAACRQAARTGLPASERPWVWACALGLHAAPPTSTPPAGWPVQAVPADEKCTWWRLPSPRDQQLLQLLCEGVEQQVLLTDVLTLADVQRMADSEHYFVFEESMRAVLLAFSRDVQACNGAAVAPSPRLAAEDGSGQLRPYPPSGVLPFQGLASLCGPLCYLYQQPSAAYRVFVAMYRRFWCCLHTLSLRPAPSPGLPVLARTFLDLLQEIDAEVYQHLVQLSGSPLDLAFPWMMSAFACHLSPAETLLLWDRIIGFDSLLPLPVLAVAVMSFRRDLVLAAQSTDELVEVLEDLSQLRVVPLLQAVLFDV